MTGWDNPCVLELLRLARGDLNAPLKQNKIPPEETLITEEGLVVDSSTGFVIRRQLVLDEGPYGYCAPLYTYDRTNRFSCLLSPCGVPLEKRSYSARTTVGVNEGKIRSKIFLVPEVGPAGGV